MFVIFSANVFVFLRLFRCSLSCSFFFSCWSLSLHTLGARNFVREESRSGDKRRAKRRGEKKKRRGCLVPSRSSSIRDNRAREDLARALHSHSFLASRFKNRRRRDCGGGRRRGEKTSGCWPRLLIDLTAPIDWD